MTEKEKLSVAPALLIECKYDIVSNDIFLFLTKEGFARLRKGDSNRNFTLTTIHEETKTRFDLINVVHNDNECMLEVFESHNEIRDPQNWYYVKLDDRGYEQLKKDPEEGSEPVVMDRYGAGYKVFVTIDEEMVASLAKNRLKNTPKIP